MSISTVPESVITLGGDWEHSSPLDLSIETKIKVLGLSALAVLQGVDTATLSGGLRNPVGISEAVGMQQYLDRIHPGHLIDVRLDEDCFDTRSSAKSVAAIPGMQDVRHTLITTKAHMLRAEKIFRLEGLDIEPAPAEELVLLADVHPQAELVERYSHSLRALKWRGFEIAMRALLAIDNDGVVAERAAGLVRSSRRSAQS